MVDLDALKDQVAWVTGAGSGIGRAAALALAGQGARVALTGRRVDALEAVAREILAAGGEAEVLPADLTDAARSQTCAQAVVRRWGRLDVLVNNAGVNIRRRSWAELDAEGAASVLRGNLTSAMNCVLAVLPILRAGGGGLIIHTASWAGRFVGSVGGPAYTAAKHAVVALSHGINAEECVNGIRSTVLCPGEVATPILDQRPVPVTAQERAQMLQPEDLGDLIAYLARLPARVCINEVLLSPTWNRGYVAALGRRGDGGI